METTHAKEGASPPGIISNITIPDSTHLGTASFVEYYLSVFWGIYPTCLSGIVVNIFLKMNIHKLECKYYIIHNLIHMTHL